MVLTNWEIAVYALYLEGGLSRPVHTEDVALRCFKLAPHSFSWIKHTHLPDKEVARSALVDARKEKYGALTTGRTGRGTGQKTEYGSGKSLDGWQLTNLGVEWVKANESRLLQELGKHEPKMHRQELLQKLSQVRNHPLFKEFEACPDEFAPSLGLLADLMRCRVDAEPIVWRRRFAALVNEAQMAEQHDIIDFLDRCHRFCLERGVCHVDRDS